MSLVFIIPRYPKGSFYYAPPIGIGHVMSALQGVGLEVVSENMNEDSRGVAQALSAYNSFKNIPSGYPTGRRFLRYACRHCNQRADFTEAI